MRVGREQGDRLPPWWYGLAYLEWERDVAVLYPLPLNYVARAWRRARWAWDGWRSGTPRLDVRVRKLVRRAEAVGYQRGYVDGWREIARALGPQ